jgi:hypothetical protein
VTAASGEQFRRAPQRMGRMKQNAHPQTRGEIIMLRKISIALVAAAALGTAALAPTSASAWGRGGFHRGFGYGYGGGGGGWCYWHPYRCN